MQITDPVHGSIEILDSEKEAINHAAFQRLRKIGQLSNVHLAFPSGTHNRFSHSLGVMHVASQIYDTLAKTLDSSDTKALNYVRQAVRLAGLLHDLGHGPYSHQSEFFIKKKKYDELGPFHIDSKDLKAGAKEPKKISHEVFSFSLIYKILKDIKHEVNPQDVCSLLDEQFQISQKFADFIQIITRKTDAAESFVSVLRSILSSHIDADRIDYLQRDTYFTGARIGRVDFDHLLGSMKLDHDGHEFFIKIRPNCVSTVEQILLARKAMFDQVYGQRTNLIFGNILQEILENAMRPSFENALKGYENYLRFTDESVNQEIQNRAYAAEDSNGRYLCRMFVMRKEPKVLSDMIFCKKVDVDHIRKKLEKEVPGCKVIELPRVELIKGEKRTETVIKEIRVANSPVGEAIQLQLASPLINSNFADEKEVALLAVENFNSEEYQKEVNDEFEKTWCYAAA